MVARFRRLNCVLMCLFIVLSQMVPPSPHMASAQPASPVMYRGDAARTGVLPDAKPLAVPIPNQPFYDGINSAVDATSSPACNSDATDKKLCTFQRAGAGTPIISNGILYVGGSYGGGHRIFQGLFAIDVKTGRQIWINAMTAAPGAPAVSDGVVYAANYDGQVLAARVVDGADVWRIRLPKAGDGVSTGVTTPVVANGVLYIGNQSGVLFAIDAASGKQLWQLNLGQFPILDPAVSNGTAFVGTADGAIYAIDGASGQTKWRVDTQGSLGAGPAVSGDSVVAITRTGSLEAVNAATGAPLWTVQAPIDEVQGCENTSSSPSFANGFVYIGDNGYAAAFDAHTGAFKWSLHHPNEAMSGPSVVKDSLYVVSSTGNLYSIDATVGTEIWRFATIQQGEQEGPVPSPPSPALGGGAVVFISTDQTLYSVVDGASVNTATTPTPTAIAASPVVASSSRLPSSDSTAEVALHRGDAARTGTQPGPGMFGLPRLDERFNGGTMDRLATSSPVGADDTIYVGTTTSTAANPNWSLDAVDTGTGIPRWQFDVGFKFDQAPALMGGVVFATGIADGGRGSGGTIFAVDASSGAEIWRRALPAVATYSPDVFDGLVFVGTADGEFYAIRQSSGLVVWKANIGASRVTGWAVGRNSVFVVDGANRLSRLDAATGNKVWGAQFQDVLGGVPSYANGFIYVSTTTGSVYAVQADTGAVNWSHSFFSGVAGSLTEAGKLLFTTRSNGSINAYNAFNGADYWTSSADGSALANSSFCDGVLYVVSAAGFLFAFDAASGAEIWRFATYGASNGGLPSTPLVLGGDVYFTNADGVLYAVTGS